jgi:cytochrome P450
MEELKPRMKQISDRILDEMAEHLLAGEEVDLHSTFSMPFTLEVIAAVLGVPPADCPALAPLVMRILPLVNPASSDEMVIDADRASAQLERYFNELMAERRKSPCADLLSAMVAAHAREERQDPLLSAVWGLWMAGFETTAAGIDGAVLTNLSHPEQSHWLRRGLTESKAFTEEALRYDPVLMLSGVSRIAARDFEISGVLVPQGAQIRWLPGAANRDPAAFLDPDRFDPSRDASKTLSFGHGGHYCLGALLARNEIAFVLPQLCARFPDLALAAPPQRRRSLPVRAYESVMVALGHPSRAARAFDLPS